MKTTYTLLLAGFAAQQASATWNFYNKFNSPKYNNNECSEKQKGGFDWSDLKDGDKNFQYGDFDFSKGWSCSNAFGKRDHITKRTFGSKVIKNTVRKDKPASFGCDKRKSGFSIVDIDVSVEFDVELELHYKMGDGSTCRQSSSCSSGGSTIKNTQCGGAKSVDVYLGKHYKGDKSECQIGFHNIGFDCSPSTGYTPPTPPTPPEVPYSSAPVMSQPVYTPPASSSPCYGGEGKCDSQPPATPTGSVATPPSCYEGEGKCDTQPPATPTGGVATPPACEGESCYPQSTPEASTSRVVETPSPSCGDAYGQGCDTPVNTPPSDVPYSTLAPYTNSSSPAYTPPPTYETPVVTPPTYGGSTVTPQPESSTKVPPPPTYESSSVSSSCGGAYGQSCDEGVSSPPSPPYSTGVPLPVTSTYTPVPSSPSYPPASPPDVLPKCINTWLQVQTECKDNTDKNCYCVKPEFTKSVIDCVSAWCGTDEETKTALQYLIGICAEHVPENPKIIEDCPSYIPLNSTSPPATPTGGVVSPPPGPNVTPIPEKDVPCTTITYGSISLTVPQVHFTTQTQNVGSAQPTEPVVLVPGTTPPSVPAKPTAVPYPVPSTFGTRTAAGATGTGVYRPSQPAEFTGAASPFGVVPKGALFGAVFALFAL